MNQEGKARNVVGRAKVAAQGALGKNRGQAVIALGQSGEPAEQDTSPAPQAE